MNKKVLTVIVISLFLILISGCGKDCPKSCDDGNACTIDTCSEATGYECVHTPIPGCTIGDGICQPEEGETRCNAPGDCGPCAGTVGAYLEYNCNGGDECLLDLSPTVKQIPKALTNEMTIAGNAFKVISTFNTPFNMNKDLFNVKVSLSKFGTNVKDLKIMKMSLTGTDESRQTISIGDKIVNKIIWNTLTAVEDNMRIDFPTAATDGAFTNLKLNIEFEYTFGGQKKTALIPITFRAITLQWVKPERQKCPASCDDNNEGTEDICGEVTDYFCQNNPIPGKCGNYVCEPGENKCTCAIDCGPCSGDAGQYLTLYCSEEDECLSQVKPTLVQEPQTLLDDKNLIFVHFSNTYSFNKPFNTKTDKFVAELSLYNKQSAVTNVKINIVRILEGTKEIAVVEPNQIFNAIGDKATIEIPVGDIGVFESEKTLLIKFWYEYTYTSVSGAEIRKAEFYNNLGKILLVNPDV